MNRKNILVSVIRFIMKFGAALGAGGFWGMLVALLLKEPLALGGDDALLLIALPVTLLFMVSIWSRLPRILRLEQ